MRLDGSKWSDALSFTLAPRGSFSEQYVAQINNFLDGHAFMSFDGTAAHSIFPAKKVIPGREFAALTHEAAIAVIDIRENNLLTEYMNVKQGQFGCPASTYRLPPPSLSSQETDESPCDTSSHAASSHIVALVDTKPKCFLNQGGVSSVLSLGQSGNKKINVHVSFLADLGKFLEAVTSATTREYAEYMQNPVCLIKDGKTKLLEDTKALFNTLRLCTENNNTEYSEKLLKVETRDASIKHVCILSVSYTHLRAHET